jgi:hypothetical protein
MEGLTRLLCPTIISIATHHVYKVAKQNSIMAPFSRDVHVGHLPQDSSTHINSQTTPFNIIGTGQERLKVIIPANEVDVVVSCLYNF